MYFLFAVHFVSDIPLEELKLLKETGRYET